MKDVMVEAPSAGQSRCSSHLYSTPLQLGQHLSKLTAQHNAIARVTAGPEIIHKTQTCPEHHQSSADRKCERPGAALPSQGAVWVVFISALFDANAVTHCPRHRLCTASSRPVHQFNTVLKCYAI